MTITPSFRLSTYLPLGVATIALGYAEASLFPEVGVFAVVVLIVLVAIHQREHRLPTMTSGETNRLGICIAVAGVVWAGFRIIRESKVGELASIGWVAFFVALVAPVLLALVCALLIKPGKKAGDIWFMQAAGLASIVLAGALAEDTLIVILTALYALSAVWFLAEFHLARQDVESKAGRARWVRPIAWLAAVTAAAVPLQLLTPRSPFDKLEFGSGRIEIGYAAEQMIDLTQTGDLQSNPETAFEVTATNSDGRPKEDLDPTQRWRGTVLVTYAGGTWRRDTQTIFPTFPNTIVAPGPWTPPDFGPNGYKLEYAVPGKLRSRFLIDPVIWQPGQVVPVAELDANPQPWIAVNNGRVFGRSTPRDDRELHYVQYTCPPLERNLGPPNVVTSEIPRMLIAYPVPAVKDYSDRVLGELVAAGKLPKDVQMRDETFLRVPERHHEKVARAFCEHLEENADLKYTTNLKRVNKSVDPVEDFLLYSKVGHCERFATALVLMLRSQGIPAVLVLGFKGAEHVGNGKYLVRQEFAHAWVEALIPRPDPDPRHRVYHWLGLDPSPVEAESASTGAAANGWKLEEFERFLFNSTPEQREQLLRSILEAATGRFVLLGAGVAVAGLFAWRTLRRRSKRRKDAGTGAAWYRALVAALQPHGLAPEPGETAEEFAARAAGSLPPEFAGLPAHWVGMHYRARFGGVTIDPEHVADLEHQLQKLAHLPENAP
jgi:hypothetical protein